MTPITAEILAIIATILTGCVVVILKFLKSSALDWTKKKFQSLFKKSIITEKDAIKEQHINELLVELRVEMDADRSYIFKFHNGEYFSPRDPVWKITCTNETVRLGISYQIHKLRNILVSSFVEFIAPLFSPTSDTRGFIQINHLDVGCSPVCEVTKNIIQCTVSELAESASKALLMERGVHKVLMVPLKKYDQILGFVGVDYCYGVPLDLKTVIPPLCKLSGQIAFLLYE